MNGYDILSKTLVALFLMIAIGQIASAEGILCHETEPTALVEGNVGLYDALKRKLHPIEEELSKHEELASISEPSASETDTPNIEVSVILEIPSRIQANCNSIVKREGKAKKASRYDDLRNRLENINREIVFGPGSVRDILAHRKRNEDAPVEAPNRNTRSAMEDDDEEPQQANLYAVENSSQAKVPVWQRDTKKQKNAPGGEWRPHPRISKEEYDWYRQQLDRLYAALYSPQPGDLADNGVYMQFQNLQNDVGKLKENGESRANHVAQTQTTSSKNSGAVTREARRDDIARSIKKRIRKVIEVLYPSTVTNIGEKYSAAPPYEMTKEELTLHKQQLDRLFNDLYLGGNARLDFRVGEKDYKTGKSNKNRDARTAKELQQQKIGYDAWKSYNTRADADSIDDDNETDLIDDNKTYLSPVQNTNNETQSNEQEFVIDESNYSPIFSKRPTAIENMRKAQAKEAEAIVDPQFDSYKSQLSRKYNDGTQSNEHASVLDQSNYSPLFSTKPTEIEKMREAQAKEAKAIVFLQFDSYKSQGRKYNDGAQSNEHASVLDQSNYSPLFSTKPTEIEKMREAQAKEAKAIEDPQFDSYKSNEYASVLGQSNYSPLFSTKPTEIEKMREAKAKEAEAIVDPQLDVYKSQLDRKYNDLYAKGNQDWASPPLNTYKTDRTAAFGNTFFNMGLRGNTKKRRSDKNTIRRQVKENIHKRRTMHDGEISLCPIFVCKDSKNAKQKNSADTPTLDLMDMYKEQLDRKYENLYVTGTAGSIGSAQEQFHEQMKLENFDLQKFEAEYAANTQTKPLPEIEKEPPFETHGIIQQKVDESENLKYMPPFETKDENFDLHKFEAEYTANTHTKPLPEIEKEPPFETHGIIQQKVQESENLKATPHQERERAQKAPAEHGRQTFKYDTSNTLPFMYHLNPVSVNTLKQSIRSSHHKDDVVSRQACEVNTADEQQTDTGFSPELSKKIQNKAFGTNLVRRQTPNRMDSDYPMVLTKLFENNMRSVSMPASKNLLASVAKQMNTSTLQLAQKLTTMSDEAIRNDAQLTRILQHYVANNVVPSITKESSKPDDKQLPTADTGAPPVQPPPNYRQQSELVGLKGDSSSSAVTGLSAEIEGVLEKVLTRLERLQGDKSSSSVGDKLSPNQKPEGGPCDLLGSWNSYEMGLRFDIYLAKEGGRQLGEAEKNNILLGIELQECTPPKHHDFLNTDWLLMGSAIKQTGGPFYMYTQRPSNGIVATFAGFCRTCGGIDTIFGAWTILYPSNDCQDIVTSLQTKRDILRRDQMQTKQRQHLKEMLFEQSKLSRLKNKQKAHS